MIEDIESRARASQIPIGYAPEHPQQQSIDNLTSIIDDLKEKLSDLEYKQIMDNLMTINNNKNGITRTVYIGGWARAEQQSIYRRVWNNHLFIIPFLAIVIVMFKTYHDIFSGRSGTIKIVW